MTDKFDFKTNAEAYSHCIMTRDYLMEIMQISESEAVAKINSFWSGIESLPDDDPLFFHEVPYFYARCIAHHPTLGDGQQRWWQDPDKWPPP